MKRLNTYLFEKFKITKNTVSSSLTKKQIKDKVFNTIYSFMKQYNIDTESWIIYNVDEKKYITNDIEEAWYLCIRLILDVKKYFKLDDLVSKLDDKVGGNVEKITSDEDVNISYIRIYFYSPE